MRNLIICPVGSPLTFDSRFDQDNHWRYTKENREYETLVFQYSDFVPEAGTYDTLIKQKGFKWSIAKEYLKTIDLTQYDFIGFIDDDLITDVANMNRALLTAKERDMKLFQLSVTRDSDMFWPILINKPGVRYTKTDFIEVMGPFIHTSLLPVCQKLWEEYDIFSGWGFDKVLCDVTKELAYVIHESQMYHPKKESSYNKSNAFTEMDHLTNTVMPKFMKQYYNEDYTFKESQTEKELVLSI